MDAELQEGESKLQSLPSSKPNTVVFTWGLNDKDQLGGVKGSKIKAPTLSDSLSKLNVAQVAGGLIQSFISTFVSANRKVEHVKYLARMVRSTSMLRYSFNEIHGSTITDEIGLKRISHIRPQRIQDVPVISEVVAICNQYRKHLFLFQVSD